MVSNSPPIAKGRGHSDHNNFGTLHNAHRLRHAATKFSTVAKADETEKSIVSTTPLPALAKFFYGTNADARSVCGS